MRTGDRIVVALGDELLCAHVADKPYPLTITGRFVVRIELTPCHENFDPVAYAELDPADEGVLWMHGETPADADVPFRVAAALADVKIALF